MSEGTTPSISISELATALRSAITAEQKLTLNRAMFQEHASFGYLQGLVDADSLTLAQASVHDSEDGLVVTGRASFLTLPELNVTLTVTAPPEGLSLSLRATPFQPAAYQLAAVSFLSIEQLAVALDVVSTSGSQQVSGSINGLVKLDNMDVPISIQLPKKPNGLLITGSISAASNVGPLALVGQVAGLDLNAALPTELGNLLTLREFQVLATTHPYLSCTVASTQPWQIVPGSIVLEQVELSASAMIESAEQPLQIELRGQALLRVGTTAIPITLARQESTPDWVLRMSSLSIPLPGVSDLVALFGGAAQLDAVPGLDGFGALSLNSLQLCFDPSRRVVSSVSFRAVAQNAWTLPLFDGVSFGQPTLAIAIEGLNPPPVSAPEAESEEAPAQPPPPYLSFRLTSARPFELVSGELSIEDVELDVGITLPAANRPRRVATRVAGRLTVGTMGIPITLSNSGSANEWVLAMESHALNLPSLADLAQLFGGADQLETFLPGLSSFTALRLHALELRMNSAQRKITSLKLDVSMQNDWSVPPFADFVLQEPHVSLHLSNPTAPNRTVTGNVAATLSLCGLLFRISARKDAPTAAWTYSGQQLTAAPISLTALASKFLGDALPSGMPEISFVDVTMELTPATSRFTLSGRSHAPWLLPLGSTALSLSNVALALSRSKVGTTTNTTVQVQGSLDKDGVSAALSLTLPGSFVLAASLPTIRLSDIFKVFGANAVLSGLGLPSSFFDLTFGPCTIAIDAAAKTASISGSASGFSAFELQLKRDARGKMGAALALQPQSGIDLQQLLGVPGLGALNLTDLVFVMSSLHDPALQFSHAAFSTVGPITRGFGFSTQVDITALGVAGIPDLPTAPLKMKAQFGRTLAEFSLSAALSAPGNRFILDPSSGLSLIDPELRICPAMGEVAVAGRIEVVLDSQTLSFTGGFKLANGRAVLFATMPGEWRSPFGISGVVARDLSLGLSLPGLPSLGGTLQIGRLTGSLLIKPDPVAPVLELQLANLDLHDLIASVCDPALAQVPASVRQTITDIRIVNAYIYVAPRATTVGTTPCAAGVTVAGHMFVWGLEIDGLIRTEQTATLPALLAHGTVMMPSLGNLLALKGGIDEHGLQRSGPLFHLELRPGQVPVVRMVAVVEVLGITASAVDVTLNDAGFSATLSGQLLGGSISAQLQISGSRLAAGASFAVAAELDASSIDSILNKAKQTLGQAITAASGEISRAQTLLTNVENKGLALTQAKEQQRQEVQAERDANTQKLRDAEHDLQTQSAQVDALLRSLAAARAQVQSERADFDRRINAAQSDVNAASQAVNSLNNEINATNQWFYGLPKVGWPHEASQAREGAWFAAKMAGLYTARDAANSVLSVAQRALQAISAAQHLFPIDLDPRVAGILAAHGTAQLALQSTQRMIEDLRNILELIPIDADFRMVALSTLQAAQDVQLIAAKAALKLAQDALHGISQLTDSFVPSVAINRAYFAGDLSTVAGGNVRLGLEITTAQGPRAFTIGFNLNNPLACATELVNRLLGTDAGAAIAAVAQSTNTAATTVAHVEQDALPTDSSVTITCKTNGQLVRVVGTNPLRYGDTISLRSANWFYLVCESNGTTNSNRTAIGQWERWVIVNPDQLGSTDYIRYGDPIALRTWSGKYLVAQDDNTVLSNRTTIGLWERFTFVRFDGVDGGSDIDTTWAIALKSCWGRYLRALGGGGGSVDAIPTTIGAYEIFNILGVNRSAEGFALVTQGNNGDIAACRFKVKRSGDWMGFQSEQSSLFVTVQADGSLRANSSNFNDATHTFSHFRPEGPALYNQAFGHYVRFNASLSTPNAPQFIDCLGQLRGAAASGFEVTQVFPSGATRMLSSPAAPREPTASDLATSQKQKSAVSAEAVAAVGPAAEQQAAQQADELGQAGVNIVEPARLSRLQAETDRRGRRERAIEKAAASPHPAASEWRDGALRFDGQSHLVASARRAVLSQEGNGTQVVEVPIIALGNQFTLEAWICPEAMFDIPRAIIGKGPASEENEICLYLSDQGRLALALRLVGATALGTSSWRVCEAVEVVKLDVFSHVAAVRDGDQVALYIDGRHVGGTTGLGSAPLHVGNSDWRIGAREGASLQNYIGLIDSVRIWNRAHNAASIRARRFLLARGNEEGLVACFNLDEQSGDTAFDASPSELHARFVGEVLRARPGAPEGPALPDRHLTLSGSAHASLGRVDLFQGSTAITIEAWVFVDRFVNPYGVIFGQCAPGAEPEYVFALDASGRLRFGWHTQGGDHYGTPSFGHVSSDGVVPIGRYCHVAVVRHGRTISFYRDGELIGTSDSADELPLRHGSAAVCIGGAADQSRGFSGSLAELRVFARNKSSDEVREHFRRPLTGAENGLVALFHLDEGFFNGVRDSGPSAYHATFAGPVSWPTRGGPPRIAGPTRALQFFGGQYVKFNDDNLFSASVAITIECWLCIDAWGEALMSIVNKWTQSFEAEYLFGVTAGGRLIFRWHNEDANAYGTPGWNEVFSETSIAAARFTHVAVVRQGRSVSFFIDGQPAGSSDPADLKPLRNGSAPLGIGGQADGAGHFLRGSIAGLRIFREARTRQELLSGMTGLVSSRALGRVLDLRFDEGESDTVLDAASGRIGTLEGQPKASSVAITVPLRPSPPMVQDDVEPWLEPALRSAQHCYETDVEPAFALSTLLAFLAQGDQATQHAAVSLAIRAGYAATAVSTACVSLWGSSAREVAQLFLQAARPAQEALAACAAVSTANGQAAVQAEAASLTRAAGYTPEALGAALCELWQHDGKSVAMLLRHAAWPVRNAAQATWTALSRHSVPSFATLCDAMLSAGHVASGVGAALKDHWGCDAASIARAVLRSGGSAAIASAVLEGVFLPAVTGDGTLYRISPSGALLLYRHRGDGTMAMRRVEIGSGFWSMTRVCAARGGHIYAIDRQGDLLYYHHDEDGVLDIERKQIGNGWGGFTWLGVGGFGQVYARTAAGVLLFYEHDSAFGWLRMTQVAGTGWGNFMHLAAGGDNSLYGVTTNGDLIYYQHDAAFNWIHDQVNLASGWSDLRALLASGDGGLYAVKESGEVLYYRHDDQQAWLTDSGRGLDVQAQIFEPDMQPAPFYGTGVAVVGMQPAGNSLKHVVLHPALSLPAEEAPLFLATAQGAPWPDTFGVSVAGTQPTGIPINTYRLDIGHPDSGWGQDLRMAWMALPSRVREHTQSGRFFVGGSSTPNMALHINFSQSFSTPPRVLCTARSNDTTATFVLTTNQISTTGVSAWLQRVDQAIGFGPDVCVDWLAWDSMEDFSDTIAKSDTALLGSHGVPNVRVKPVHVDFAEPFHAPPVVLLTPRGDVSAEPFAVTLTAVSASGFDVNVVRTDGTTTWEQELRLDYLAVVPEPTSFVLSKLIAATGGKGEIASAATRSLINQMLAKAGFGLG